MEECKAFPPPEFGSLQTITRAIPVSLPRHLPYVHIYTNTHAHTETQTPPSLFAPSHSSLGIPGQSSKLWVYWKEGFVRQKIRDTVHRQTHTHTHVHLFTLAHTHTLSQQSNMSGVQKCDAVIRGTEYSDYALILSSACSFYHLSFSVAVSPSASFCPTAFCCWRDTAGALERSTTMKSLWTEGTHMQTRSHTETFQPSQAPSRIEEIRTTEKKEASRERDGETKSRRLRFHSTSSAVHISHSLCCLSSLVSDPPRRIAAVKLLTSSSTSVVTPLCATQLFLQVCVCGCQPKFLTSS